MTISLNIPAIRHFPHRSRLQFRLRHWYQPIGIYWCHLLIRFLITTIDHNKHTQSGIKRVVLRSLLWPIVRALGLTLLSQLYLFTYLKEISQNWLQNLLSRFPGRYWPPSFAKGKVIQTTCHGIWLHNPANLTFLHAIVHGVSSTLTPFE